MECKNKKKSIYSTAILIVIIEILIKIIGFVKQSVIAYYYGADNDMDIYFVASDFINGLSNSIINSAKIAIISVYTSIRIKKGKEEGDNLISILIKLLIPLALACTLFLSLISKVLSKVLGPNYSGDNLDKLSLYIKILSGIFILSIICMIFDAILNSHEKYYVPRFRSLIYSTGTIIGCVVFAKYFGVDLLLSVQYLTLLVYIVIQLISSKNLFVFRYRTIECKNEVKLIIGMMIPTFIGNSVVQLNYWVDNAVATTLDEGSVSALSYSHVLDDFFIGIMISSVSSIIFPHLANLVEKENKAIVKDTLNRGLSTMFLILVPISIIAFFGAKDMVKVAFFRGKFNIQTLSVTTLALQGYVLRYPFIAIRDISIQGLYAYKKAKKPMYVAMIAAVINIIFSVVLSKYWGIIAITIGTTISAIFGAIMNFRNLRSCIDGITYKKVFGSIHKIIPMALISVIAVIFEIRIIYTLNSIINFAIIAITVILIYFGGMILMKEQITLQLIAVIKNKLHIHIKNN